MRKLVYTSAADKHIESIGDYTQEHWGVAQRNKYILGLFESIALIANSPQLGTHQPEIRDDVYRFSKNSHDIYYLIEPQQIIVFGVIDQRQEPALHLDIPHHKSLH